MLLTLIKDSILYDSKDPLYIMSTINNNVWFLTNYEDTTEQRTILLLMGIIQVCSTTEFLNLIETQVNDKYDRSMFRLYLKAGIAYLEC
jgi:predicted CDP-diglyceride synthetase/phosphatidate cytidylyltransferase